MADVAARLRKVRREIGFGREGGYVHGQLL
jgi:hypothetical protein